MVCSMIILNAAKTAAVFMTARMEAQLSRKRQSRLSSKTSMGPTVKIADQIERYHIRRKMQKGGGMLCLFGGVCYNCEKPR